MSFLRNTLFALVTTCALGTAAMSTPARLQDVFVGNGTAGPYRLTWKKITANTESVKVNSLLQVRNLDYTLDANTGALMFAKPLSTNAALVIVYDYDTDLAQRSAGNGVTLPIAMDLAHTNNATLSLNAVYKNQNGLSSQQAGAQSLSLGLGGVWRGGNATQVTTRWYYAPALNAGQSGDDDHNSLADRSGFSLLGGTDAGKKVRLSFGYSKAGQGMGSAASDNGLIGGAQVVTLGSHIMASRQVTADLGYSQTDLSGDNSVDTKQTSLGVTVTPSKTLTAQTHIVDQQASDGTQTVKSDLAVNSQVTTKTTVGATFAQTETSKDDDKTQVANSGVTVKSQVTDKAIVGASYAQTQSSTTDDTNTINLSAAVTPSQKVALNATASQTQLSEGTTNTQQVGLSLTPTKTVKLDTGIALSQAEQSSTMVASIGSAIQPVSFLKVSAGYQHRQATGANIGLLDTLDGSTAQVTLMPIAGLNLTGTYAQNPMQNGLLVSRSARRGLGGSAVLGSFSVAGGYDWTRSYDNPDVATQVHIDLGLKLAPGTQLTGGYVQAFSGLGDTPTGREQYSLGFRRSLGDRFSLALDGRMLRPAGAAAITAADYSANANLGVKF